MTRKTALVAVVALLAVGMSAALALGAAPHATNDAAATQETTTAATPTADAANVTFENVTSNGTAVTVAEVAVPEGGFAVIHEAENDTTAIPAQNETEFEGVPATETTVAADGEGPEYTPGEVLGNSTYLEPGVHEDVTVELNESLDESRVLIAMAHQDTNDNRQYDFPEADDPYTEDGQPVIDWANVTLEGDAAETTETARTTTEEAA